MERSCVVLGLSLLIRTVSMDKHLGSEQLCIAHMTQLAMNKRKVNQLNCLTG